ncbi:MAG: hypothetical protein RQ952_02935 [Thermoproteota archaeon]|jgi:ssDNA-binding replication factor A large subunit|nr:hypothetical protein [Thermoproteota archaeon]
MKIYQVEAGMINVSIIATVKDQETVQNGKYKTILEDGTGKITMLLNEKLTIGTVLKVEKAYAYKYRGQLCITLMKKGKIRKY